MQLSLFIAKRLAWHSQHSFSGFIIKLAVIAVALSVCIMILGGAITQGYQDVITKKFYNSWGHLHVTPYLSNPNDLFNDQSFIPSVSLEKKIATIDNIQHVNAYKLQPAIIKSQNQLEGIILRGVRQEDSSRISEQFNIKTSILGFNDTSYSNSIILSSALSTSLNLNVGDNVLVYFLNKNEFQPRVRKLEVKGIYTTGLEDYDKKIALCDMALLQHINQEDTLLIQGYEIILNDYKKADKTKQELDITLEPPLASYSIQERFTAIFSWLGMMQMNERIILIIMLAIAIVNSITAMLILILERTRMIGLLRAMGMTRKHTQFIFIYWTLGIVFVGMCVGNALALLLSWLQQHYQLIKLDEKAYFIESVPVLIQWQWVLKVNLIILLFATATLLIPSLIIRTISITKAIQLR